MKLAPESRITTRNESNEFGHWEKQTSARTLHRHCSGPYLGNTPTPTTCVKSTAVHLQFVRQYAPHLYRRTFLASKLRRKGNPPIRLPFVLQYASQLYGSTPPICTAVLLEKYWGLGSPERFWLSSPSERLFGVKETLANVLQSPNWLWETPCVMSMGCGLMLQLRNPSQRHRCRWVWLNDRWTSQAYCLFPDFSWSAICLEMPSAPKCLSNKITKQFFSGHVIHYMTRNKCSIVFQVM